MSIHVNMPMGMDDYPTVNIITILKIARKIWKLYRKWKKEHRKGNLTIEIKCA